MNRQEVAQYQVAGVGVFAGADIDFGQPSESPCWRCGEPVDLSVMITVNIVDGDSVTTTEITEANARALLAQVGMGSPDVLCSEHEEVTMELP